MRSLTPCPSIEIKKRHTLSRWRLMNQSGRRDSNPRISAWKADALPLGDSRVRSVFYHNQDCVIASDSRKRSNDTVGEELSSPALRLGSPAGSLPSARKCSLNHIQPLEQPANITAFDHFAPMPVGEAFSAHTECQHGLDLR